MGPLDGLVGNASKVYASTERNEFAQALAPGKRVKKAYQSIRHLIREVEFGAPSSPSFWTIEGEQLSSCTSG